LFAGNRHTQCTALGASCLVNYGLEQYICDPQPFFQMGRERERLALAQGFIFT